jgi:hypothetical protein
MCLTGASSPRSSPRRGLPRASRLLCRLSLAPVLRRSLRRPRTSRSGAEVPSCPLNPSPALRGILKGRASLGFRASRSSRVMPRLDRMARGSPRIRARTKPVPTVGPRPPIRVRLKPVPTVGPKPPIRVRLKPVPTVGPRPPIRVRLKPVPTVVPRARPRSRVRRAGRPGFRVRRSLPRLPDQIRRHGVSTLTPPASSSLR